MNLVAPKSPRESISTNSMCYNTYPEKTFKENIFSSSKRQALALVVFTGTE